MFKSYIMHVPFKHESAYTFSLFQACGKRAKKVTTLLSTVLYFHLFFAVFPEEELLCICRNRVLFDRQSLLGKYGTRYVPYKTRRYSFYWLTIFRWDNMISKLATDAFLERNTLCPLNSFFSGISVICYENFLCWVRPQRAAQIHKR